MLLVNHSNIQFEVKMGDHIAQLIIKKISLDKLNEENNLSETKRGDQGFGLTGVVETPKISILKKPKKQPAKTAESPCVILPERVDKRPSQEKTAELSKPMAMAILPTKVDKQSRQGWMNTVDPWTS